MALASIATIITAGGFAWKYKRIPVRFYHWYKAPETEPKVGQTWRSANFRVSDSDWTITEVTEDTISFTSTTDYDPAGDFWEVNMGWDGWASEYVGKRRFYCADRNDSVEDTYWGEHSED